MSPFLHQVSRLPFYPPLHPQPAILTGTFLSVVVEVQISYLQCCCLCGLDSQLYHSFTLRVHPDTLLPIASHIFLPHPQFFSFSLYSALFLKMCLLTKWNLLPESKLKNLGNVFLFPTTPQLTLSSTRRILCKELVFFM